MRHEFVEYIPKELQPDTVYVSMENETVAHSCFCGCGGRIVTPLSPAAWKLTFDGDSISLHPSIGNWNLECKSHYWIRGGRVVWAEQWSEYRIEAGRRWEAKKREEYYLGRDEDEISSKEVLKINGHKHLRVWPKIKSWFR